jgi:hypothetical protein
MRAGEHMNVFANRDDPLWSLLDGQECATRLNDVTLISPNFDIVTHAILRSTRFGRVS